MQYADVHRLSIEQRDAFWQQEAQLIDWHRPFDRVVGTDRLPHARWFDGGQTNLCHNAVDRWAARQPDARAIVHVSTELDPTDAEKERGLRYHERVAMAFVVARDPGAVETPAQRQALEASILQTVDRQLGAVARPARAVIVSMLPKTRSGKVLRRSIQAICENRATGDLTTIEDAGALDALREAMQ